MDLIKAWLFAAAAFVVVNLALSFTIGASLPWLYLLPVFVAGLVASAYHAQLGRGGWPRHFLAVLTAPVLIAVYWIVLRILRTGEMPALTAAGVIGTSVLAAAAGLGVVMAVRLLIAQREPASAPPGGAR